VAVPTKQDQFLFDTTIWIELSRRVAREELKRRAKELIAERAAATNEVVRLELLVGSRNKAEFRTNSTQLGSLVQFAIEESTWSHANNLGFELRRKGFTPSVPDLLIAASAMEQRATLVHADSDFDQIAALTDLRVESYAKSAS